MARPKAPAAAKTATAAAAAAAAVIGGADAAWSLPQGMVVRGGQLSIEQIKGNSTVIRQGSQRAAADFKGFDIRAGERVRIDQPNQRSTFLGRVTSGTITELHGQLDANGRVLLINPAGVLVGPGGVVNTAAFTATTLHADPDQFMQGGVVELKALPGFDPKASVINQGTINVADGGFAALLAPHVANDGVITARLGQVQLASGTAATLDISGDGLISVMLDPSVEGSISNSGTIRASHVRLGGGDAAALTAATVNISGVIEARSAAEVLGLSPSATAEGGRIEVATSGAITLSGRLDASAQKPGFSGGTVKLLGEWINLDATARVNASGPAGGGEILIGGNYLGQGPEPNAKQVLIAAGAEVRADATELGDGGRVIVWSDERTEFHGLISAQGGPEGGDGGFVETSSKQTLVVTGEVTTAAPKGEAGQWLLDPEDVTVGEEAAAEESSSEASAEESSEESTSSAEASSDDTAAASSDSSSDAEAEEEEEEEEAAATAEDTASEATSSDEGSSGSFISESSIEKARAEGTDVTVVSSGSVSGATSEEGTDGQGSLTVISGASDPAAAVAAAGVGEPSTAPAPTTTVATVQPLAPQPASSADLYTLYLNGSDLNLSAQQEQLLGRNVLIASCEGSCISDRIGNVFIDSLAGLASLQVQAPADVRLSREISVSGGLSFAGALILSGSEVKVSANELVLKGPVMVSEAVQAAGGAALSISSASADRAIQLGGVDQASVNLDAPAAALQLGNGTLAALNQAGLRQLSIGAADHSGGINLDAGAELQANRAVQLQSQTVNVAGSVRAGDGERGGVITVIGDHLKVASTAKLDASGPSGGGEILVGGSWQNSKPEIRQAITTAIEAGAVLDASAISNGKGGTIVAWSDINNPQ
ncbi:MAG: filamentous hemagglutinin N-terminal domain-containing protein, partial [Prochlorococcaceae cyanobacterium]